MLSARPRDSSQATARLTERTTATNDPAPSLHPHYRGFRTTTSRSASVSRDGTHVPTGHSRLGHSLSPPAAAAVSGHAFSRSAREPQTGLTPPPRRTPPGQYTGTRQAHPGTHTIAPVLMPSEQSYDASAVIVFPAPTWRITCAFSSSLTTTVFSQRSMRRFEASPRRAAPKGHRSFISRTAPHPETHLPTWRAPLCVRDTRCGSAGVTACSA